MYQLGERACDNCGADLAGKRKSARFCNQRCKNQRRLKTYTADWLAEMEDRQCGTCGAPLLGRRRDSKWCSDRCARAGTRESRAAAKRKHLLKSQYGIDEAEYERLFLAQHGRCAICRSTEPKHHRGRWAVDHDHVTGQVRGLLCSRCNTGIGQLRDDPEIIMAAVRYIRKHRQLVMPISPS